MQFIYNLDLVLYIITYITYLLNLGCKISTADQKLDFEWYIELIIGEGCFSTLVFDYVSDLEPSCKDQVTHTASP